MKVRTWIWSFISVGLILSLIVPAAGQASPALPQQEFTPSKNSLVDQTGDTNKIPNASTYWGLTVTVNDIDLGYVVVHGDDESTRTTNGYFQGNFKEGFSVSLEAHALAGAEFDRWSGDIEDSAYGGAAYGESRQNPLNLLMWGSDRAVTAQFVKTYDLNLECSPPEGGSISGASNGSFQSGEKVTLTAQPKSGFLFMGWEGDIGEAQFLGEQIILTMDKDRNIAAEFAEIFVPPPFETELFPDDPNFGWRVDLDLPWSPMEGLGIFGSGLGTIPQDLKSFPPMKGAKTLEDLLDVGVPIKIYTPEEIASLGIDGILPLGKGLLPPFQRLPADLESPDFKLPWELGKSEKPLGALPAPKINKLEVVISPGRSGAVFVTSKSIQGKGSLGNLELDLSELPIKQSAPPEGTWDGAMTFSWLIEPNHTIQLTAKPFEGYRFDRWETVKFKKTEENSPTGITFWGVYGPKYNPENPVLTIDRLRGDLRLQAYFVPILPGEEGPEDALPEGDQDTGDDDTEGDAGSTPIDININITSETVEDESNCDSIVTIEYEAIDTSGGSHLIDYVQLDIDGEEEYSWSGTPEPSGHYEDDFLLESDCTEVHTVQVKAINEDGETVIATEEARIPPLDTFFDWLVLDTPSEGDDQMQLFINYEAFDLFTPENPITNVVVKANGITWHSSGSISSLSYEDSFMKLVGCGNTYTIEVIGTDSDGNRYTYRERITIPEEEPEDTPPPPPSTPQETLYAAYAASAHCTSSGYECSCQLTVSFDGKDLTLGDYPVKQVILKVNGSEWYNSGTITETHHHDSVTRTVSCGQTFNFQLIVRNSIGQEVISTGSINTPGP